MYWFNSITSTDLRFFIKISLDKIKWIILPLIANSCFYNTDSTLRKTEIGNQRLECLIYGVKRPINFGIDLYRGMH
jgi:hypothetical protein